MSHWTRSNQVTCPKKWTYRNKAQAQHYGGLFQQLPYRCEACGRWHLTSRGLPK